MYASAWIFVSAPIVVSFSTREPRPMTTSSPTTQRSRTQAWSPTITRAPIFVPAKTIAPVDTMVPGPSSSGASASRCAIARGLDAVALAAHEREEVLALELERLVVRDVRNVDRPRARHPLAVVRRRLPRPLLVHRHLALQLHVVEDDHLVLSDDRDPAHLVRVEPREVHVRDLPAREAQVAEDDVLHARVQKRVAASGDLARLLVEQVEDHGEVVNAERPERVLVLADDPEVLAVAVDAEHLAELPRVDELFQLPNAWVV